MKSIKSNLLKFYHKTNDHSLSKIVFLLQNGPQSFIESIPVIPLILSQLFN